MKKFAKKTLCALLVVLMCFASVSIGGFSAAAVNVTDGKTYISKADLASGYITLGSYPQTRVTDEATLNALGDKLPTFQEWYSSSYKYYRGTGRMTSMKPEDFMYYWDVTLKGEKYRCVLITDYRPKETCVTSSAQNSWQDENGYTPGIYWFKFEPLKWRVLDKETGYIMCESIIDSQPFNNTLYQKAGNTYSYYSDPSCIYAANDYAASSVRAWLNNDFYNTAFSAADKTAIGTSKLNGFNSYYTDNGLYEDGGYLYDKISLLSGGEALNKYGFIGNYQKSDPARLAQGTDYAKCQGLYVANYTDNEYMSKYTGNSDWLLRSTHRQSTQTQCEIVNTYGGVSGHIDESMWYSYITDYGIRPVLTLNLHTHNYSYKEEIISTPTHNNVGYKTCHCYCGAKYTVEVPKVKHTYTASSTDPATCTETGLITYTCTCGDEYTTIVPALGHDDVYTVIKEATATETGKRKHTCKRCSLEVYEDIPVKGSGLTISVGDVKLDYKASKTLAPEITNTGKASYKVFYSSDSPNVTVDENGKIYGAKTGSANITVTVTDTAGNTDSDICKVEVSYNWWQWIIVIVLFGWIWY